MSPSTTVRSAVAPSVRDRVTALDEAISELTDRAARAAEHLARLDEQIEQRTRRLARGSMDISPADVAELTRELEVKTNGRVRSKRDTEQTPAPAAPPTPESRLESALRAKASTISDLGRATKIPMARIANMLEGLRKEGRVVNVGTESAPRFTWVVSDECSPDELRQAIRVLISERPMSFAELLAATGARRGRISGQIVDLQRTGQPVLNLGTERRARWFLAARPLVK